MDYKALFLDLCYKANDNIHFYRKITLSRNLGRIYLPVIDHNFWKECPIWSFEPNKRHFKYKIADNFLT